MSGTAATRLLVVGLLAGLAGCSATSSSVPASSGTAPDPSASASIVSKAQDWVTYHASNDRDGLVPAAQPVHGLSQGWKAQLDGAVYGQPLVLGDVVIAATEQDSVYALDLADGHVFWRRSLGRPVPKSDLPCGNIDPLGITGSPAYDAESRSVFVVAETTDARHDLVALDPSTGSVRLRTSLDVTNRDRHAEQQRGALAVAGGRVYVPFGGLAGDCGNYVGYVTATPVHGDGPTLRYEIPTGREGGIWAASGVAVDPTGDVWVAVGNGASVGDPYDGSDSVVRLSPDLSVRRDFFAPSDWGTQNAADADLGSTGPLLLSPAATTPGAGTGTAAGPDQVLISGKGGEVFLLDARRLGGIGGQVAVLNGCTGFGGMAWDAAQRAAFVPCTDGLQRVEVGPTTVQAGWRAASQVNGTPVVGAGVVWSLDAGGGVLHVLDETDGHEIASADTGTTSRFASPVVAGRHVVVPTLDGLTALSIS